VCKRKKKGKEKKAGDMDITLISKNGKGTTKRGGRNRDPPRSRDEQMKKKGRRAAFLHWGREEEGRAALSSAR